MYSDAEKPVMRPLGYDLRVTGGLAEHDRNNNGMIWRPELLAASYDSAVQPPLIVTKVEENEKADFQRVLDSRMVSDPYFQTFHLFRSDREAFSFWDEHIDPKDIEILFYALIWPDQPPTGIFLGMLEAMEGEVVPLPSIQADFLGYEILDSDGGSVTHTYYDLHEALSLEPDKPRSEANRLARDGFWMVSIFRVSDQLSECYELLSGSNDVS